MDGREKWGRVGSNRRNILSKGSSMKKLGTFRKSHGFGTTEGKGNEREEASGNSCVC